jgi:arsenate reductase
MAEGFARSLKGDVIEAFSAGVEPKGLNPLAVRAMAEVGIDISGQRSRHIEEFKKIALDYVITVCGHAHETCPVFPGRTRVVHVGFDDPPALARNATSDEEAMVHYRRVRDEIRRFVENIDKTLPLIGETKP